MFCISSPNTAMPSTYVSFCTDPGVYLEDEKKLNSLFTQSLVRFVWSFSDKLIYLS